MKRARCAVLSAAGFSCLACRASEGRFVLEKAGLELRRCRSCGLVQQHPVPGAEALSAMYEQEAHYAGQLVRGEAEVLAREREVVAQLAARGASGPFLDVGAGAGLLLRAARERGFSGIALELSAPSAELIARTLDVAVHQAAIEEAPLAPESVGVVAFSHSLEHLGDPVGARVRRARELLRPGGLVHVAVPNWRAAKRVLAGRHTPWIYAHHISYFERRTLAALLRRAGFEPLSFTVGRFVGLDYPFILACLRRFRLERSLRRFLSMGERPLEELIADGVRIACPVWRYRAVVGCARLFLRLWPERLCCALGRGEELRATAVSAGAR
ncbi:MAG: class I SAM-dependent methyltransferase [Planctomycetes bacterium]|nr:class I SAM-dependent methyltransferase [Planctomycetota bacterium]